MKLQETLWRDAQRNLATAQERLERIQRDIELLGDRFVTSSRRDIRGIMSALQDADTALAQYEAVKWAENQKGLKS